jgi:hypothetical protein
MLWGFHFAVLLLRGESIVERICEIILVQYCYIFLLPVVATCCLPSLFFLLHCIHFIVCMLTVIIDPILTCLLIHAQNVVCILDESIDI